MAKAYRYVIALDRYADETDYGPESGYPDAHDGTDAAAMEQVAAELEEAMEQSGCLVGAFEVVGRFVIEKGGGE